MDEGDVIMEYWKTTLRDQLPKEPKRRRAIITAIALSAMYVTALIVCFLVNFFTSKQIDWFYIVLTSVLTAFSITVVPLVCTTRRLIDTLGCFIVSLILLFFAITEFTKADWFPQVTSIVISGILIVSSPFIIRHIPLKESLSDKKALLVMIADTVLVANILLVTGLYVDHLDYFRIAGLVAPVCMLLPWYLFYVIRYTNGVVIQKVGLCLIGLGVFNVFLPFYINTIVLSKSNGGLIWNIISGGVFILAGIFLTFVSRKNMKSDQMMHKI